MGRGYIECDSFIPLICLNQGTIFCIIMTKLFSGPMVNEDTQGLHFDGKLAQQSLVGGEA